MSIIAPDSDVTLYAGVESSDNHRPIFSSIANQRSYFAGKVYRTKVGCTYCNGNAGDPLILEIPISEMYNFNYMSFKNKAFENKEIYAKALPPIYVNNEVMAVPYEIDWFQTRMFDITMDRCNCERETPTIQEYNDYEVGAPYKNDAPSYFYTIEPFSFNIALKAASFLSTSTSEYNISAGGVDYEIIADLARSGKFEYDMLTSYGGADNLFTSGKIVVIVSQDFESLSEDDDRVKTCEPKMDPGTRFPNCSTPYVFNAEDGFPAVGVQEFRNLQEFLNAYATKGAISSIIGVYYLPNIFVKPEAQRGVKITLQIDQPINTITGGALHSKLKRYPYTYIRVTDYLGNKKEYKLEDFIENNGLASGNGKIKASFLLKFTINGYPQVVLAPLGYQESNSNLANFNEKMVITEFPQVSYNTDGFLTYLGSVMRGQIVKDSTAHPWAYNGILHSAGETIKTIGKVAIGAATGGGAGAAVQGFSALPDLWKDAWEFGKKNELHRAGQEFAERQYKGVVIPDSLWKSQEAFANDEYHSGGSTVAISAYQFGRLGFTFEIITPKSHVADNYDTLLDFYGYRKDIFKTPSVYNYFRNVGAAESKPHFNASNLCYCKTADCSVHGVDEMSEKYIEQIFNGGCWFVKGD